MAPSKHTSSLLALALLAFTASSHAQLSDLPDIDTVTQVLGATSTSSASAIVATSGSATASTDTSGQTGAVTTTVSSIIGGLTDAPTLYGVGVPPLIVPDTSGAPFMHKSRLPEGFVFICVGAALAFCGLIVLAWRGLVAWSLSRSVKRTASDRYISEKKSLYGAPTDYSSAYTSADVSLVDLTTKDPAYKSSAGQQRQSKSHSKPPQRTSRPPSNLFFSPTAGAGQNAMSRSSTYLPAGYYASPGSTIAAGASIANFGGPPAARHGRIDSSDDIPTTTSAKRPQSGYDRSMSRERQSMLDVPTREHRRKGSNLRTSSHEPTARAPSAMLDDLFEHHTGMR